jgi:hypothetical protein
MSGCYNSSASCCTRCICKMAMIIMNVIILIIVVTTMHHGTVQKFDDVFL